MVSPHASGPQDPAGSVGSDVKWYAGLAMQAMLARQGIPESESAREEIALWAFRMAQAMTKMDHQLHASATSSGE